MIASFISSQKCWGALLFNCLLNPQKLCWLTLLLVLMPVSKRTSYLRLQSPSRPVQAYKFYGYTKSDIRVVNGYIKLDEEVGFVSPRFKRRIKATFFNVSGIRSQTLTEEKNDLIKYAFYKYLEHTYEPYPSASEMKHLQMGWEMAWCMYQHLCRIWSDDTNHHNLKLNVECLKVKPIVNKLIWRYKCGLKSDKSAIYNMYSTLM